ncbi:MAG: phasin family protein [Vicinamibacteria bacterium]|nr:phasin family protein [Vicinamibacteria bacterium]
MAAKKTPRPARAARTAKTAKTAKAAPKGALQNAWAQTLGALHNAQVEAEKQIHLLLKKNKLDAKDAAGVLDHLRARLDKERKGALKQLEAQAGKLQHRLDKERKAVSKLVDDAVRNALAAVNIPSREEVVTLSRKVDELSRKIDGMKRR